MTRLKCCMLAHLIRTIPLTWQEMVSCLCGAAAYMGALWCLKRFFPNAWGFLPDFEEVLPRVAAILPGVLVVMLVEKLLSVF